MGGSQPGQIGNPVSHGSLSRPQRRPGSSVGDRAAHATGAMFWFSRNRFPGSYCVFSRASRA